jgi:hypothetical protein
MDTDHFPRRTSSSFCFAFVLRCFLFHSIFYVVFGLGGLRREISVFEENLVEPEVQGTMYSAGTQMGLVLTPKPSTSETLRLEAVGWGRPKMHVYSNREKRV